MTLIVRGHPFAYEMENVLRLFCPGARIEVLPEGDPSAPDTVLTEVAECSDGAQSLAVSLHLGNFSDRAQSTLPAAAEDGEVERALGRMLFALLKAQTGSQPAWGTLTGVRPVRLCRSMAAEGLDDAAIRDRLARDYLVSPEKANLTLEILGRQRGILAQAAPNGFSLYIHIPFCPSRCLYCSFISHDLEGARKLLPRYVELLCEEIRRTGAVAARRGLKLQTIYIGGGTPTTLEPAQLEQIMAAVAENFDLSAVLEYTVEAGRPDTLSAEKLATLRRMGADRVSVNPQTMNDEILRAIGRNHSAAQVVEGLSMARAAGFETVNMDIIAGLPGESGESFADTVSSVLALRPENVTVHTLTVKRSSRLREQADAFAAPKADPAALLAHAAETLAAAGYRPYYLYRQKGTVENLENIGWALPGHEGLYNVLIMEELQTILAVGAGAVTKLYHPERPLRRIWNYKFPYEYIDRFDEILRRKAQAERFMEEWP